MCGRYVVSAAEMIFETEIAMRVTGIEELNRTRSRVFLDDKFAFVLYKGELRLYHLAVGEEVGQRDYEAIMGQLLPKRAKLRAMNLLKSREYTVRQLHDKLQTGGYPEQVIGEALAYVADYHYTDDLRYAVDYISSREGERSRRRIEQDLSARGIDRSTLEEAWRRWREQGGRQDEQRMIRELLEKKHYDPDTADAGEKRRICAFLLRRGFSAEQVMKALHAEDGE